jgi:hypothetical protein
LTTAQAIPPKPLPRLPDRLLQDFRPTGAVYIIAKACYDKRRAKGLKALDFKHPARKREVRASHTAPPPHATHDTTPRLTSPHLHPHPIMLPTPHLASTTYVKA